MENPLRQSLRIILVLAVMTVILASVIGLVMKAIWGDALDVNLAGWIAIAIALPIVILVAKK